MKKTVGMMTSEESFLNNYGAALQGYALQRTIRGLGYEPKIIRYNGYGPKRRFGWIKDIIKKVLRVKKGQLTKEQKDRLEYLKSVSEAHKDEIEKRTVCFQTFQDETMQFYSSERMTWEKLKKNPPQFDIYVCGSDQIWNPVFHGGICDRGYFLDFAPADRKRIAYAPSLGTDYLPETCKNEMKMLIDKMCAVAVREEKGAELLTDLMGRRIDTVLDPTLLLSKEEWLEVARVPENIPEKYILCYRFSDNPETLSAVKELSHRTGLPVVSLPLSPIAMEDPFMNIYEVGPREFIGLISKASLVCTDSFHATVFSFLMNTPFLTFMREQYSDGTASMNSRVVNLLKSVDLTSRIVAKLQDVNMDTLFDNDYSSGKQTILSNKKRSIDYLKEALEREIC